MSFVIRIRAMAQAELTSAIAWYETAQPGLGDQFAAAVADVLNAVAATPLMFPAVEDDARQAAVPGYPYCVYYRVRGQLLIVVAIYRQSRDPSGWHGRT